MTQAMRRVMTVVLPVPAPATIKSGPASCVTAWRWASFRPSRIRSPAMPSRLYGRAAASSNRLRRPEPPLEVLGCPQRQGGDGERWRGRRRGDERAAADQVQIVEVVDPEIRVDDADARIGAHAVGADLVGGRRDGGEPDVRGSRRLENPLRDPPGGLEAVQLVAREPVRDL